MSITWRAVAVEKSFPGVQALKGVDLELKPGEVHALVGENGCGKSTLIKVFSGVHQQDAGEVMRDAVPVRFESPRQARAAGVATIYQEYSLVGGLSVAENISLGTYRERFGVIDRKAIVDRATEALGLLQITLDLDAPVNSLSVADQQIVEIAKAVSAQSSLLILDEPTTSLSVAEVDRLHELIGRLRAAGKSVLYVSHRLEELFGVANAVTVMRDGAVVRQFDHGNPPLAEVVEAMVGRNIDQFYASENLAQDDVLLEVSDLYSDTGLAGVSFGVRRGEILGLAGVVGSGRTEILRAIFGVDPIRSGSVSVAGKDVGKPSIESSIGFGMGFVPENRKTDGLFFNLDAPMNLSAASIASLRKAGLLDLASEKNRARELIEQFTISAHAMETPVDKLSGGNQQKITLARWVFARSQVLLLDEPTQGIDVGAKQEVYRILNELTRDGVAVVMVSSDLPELLAMSNRVVVIRNGRSGPEIRASETSEIELINLMSGDVNPEDVAA